MFTGKNRILVIMMVLTFCIGLFSGCKKTTESSEAKYHIVCTTFPQYDWVMQILGDNAAEFEVTLLLDNGMDLHSYQPTAEDVAKIANCDLFIYVGGESDIWVEDVLQETTNPNMQVINMIDTLGNLVKEEEIVEGMEDNHEHSDEEHEHDDEEHEHHHEKDEHIWLSIKNAKVLVEKICEAVKGVDKEKESLYQSNYESYLKELSVLDEAYEEMAADAAKKTVLFADRFPFRYLLEDYGISYYAAFSGCSAETEASFETVAFLAGKADELELNVILVIENSDKTLAQTIVENTKKKDKEILTLNSLQSVTSEDVKNGITYLSVMQDNLKVLTETLK